MNLEANSRVGRAWTASTVAIFVCVGAMATIISGSAFAQQIAAPSVQGELITAQPRTNVVPAASQPPPAVTVAAKSGDYLQVGFDKLAGFPLRLHWVLVDPVRIKGVQS